MFGHACAEHLPGIQRRPTRPCHPMCSSSLADGITARQIGPPPGIDHDTAVHVLVVHRKLQRLTGNVDLVAPVEFDREGVHMPQPVDRQFLHRAGVFDVAADIGVETIKVERKITGNCQRIAIEIHEDPPPGRRLAEDCKVDQT
ncbi:hypothetical protein D3C80_1096010 [compost metagenome]